MTYREKLKELGNASNAKAELVDKIEEDFRHAGFQDYTLTDYNRALDEHANAVNAHGKLVNQMVKNGCKIDDEIFD